MIRGLWDRETVALLLVAALLPLAAIYLHAGGANAASRLAVVLLVFGGWQILWMLARAQPPSLACIATAIGVAILVPQGTGNVPLLLGLSFGAVFGELAFGGWGRNVLHPGTVALAFLGFGFPAIAWPELPVQFGWAACAGAVLGVLTGVLSIRLIAGAGLVAAVAIWTDPGLADLWVPGAVVLVLLVADPVASASTPAGRWLNGALYAGLLVLFHLTWTSATGTRMAVSSALLASLAAPLLDEIALALWTASRRRRFG